MTLRERVREFERNEIERAIRESKSFAAAARALGYEREYLYRKAKRVGADFRKR